MGLYRKVGVHIWEAVCDVEGGAQAREKGARCPVLTAERRSLYR